MKKETLVKAQDLYDCILGNKGYLKQEQVTIEKLKRMNCRADGTITININEEIGFARILVSDVIKVSEQRCEMLEKLIEKLQKEFDEL